MKYTKQDFDNSDWRIRLGAYRYFDFPKEAEHDSYYIIKLEVAKHNEWKSVRGM